MTGKEVSEPEIIYELQKQKDENKNMMYLIMTNNMAKISASQEQKISVEQLGQDIIKLSTRVEDFKKKLDFEETCKDDQKISIQQMKLEKCFLLVHLQNLCESIYFHDAYNNARFDDKYTSRRKDIAEQYEMLKKEIDNIDNVVSRFSMSNNIDD